MEYLERENIVLKKLIIVIIISLFVLEVTRLRINLTFGLLVLEPD